MATGTATIGDMPKKKTGKPGRPAGRKPTAPIFARVDLDLFEACHAYVAGLEPKTTVNAIVALALKEHLRSKGHWPPLQKPKRKPPEPEEQSSQ
jgi:hypothetical protein